jgi:uncharacterized membrane protein (DUF2068 family)
VKQSRGDGFLRLIAAFKFFKALLLLGAGLGALELVHPAIAAEAQEWADGVAATLNSATVDRVLASATGLAPQRLRALGIVAFLYAALFLVEGTGLWRGRRWAEYLTVIATCSLVPFEIYELIRQVTWLRTAALVINVAVVIYLIYRLRREPAYFNRTAKY